MYTYFDIPSLQNELSHIFSSTGFCFKAKLWKVVMKCKITFQILAIFLKTYLSEVVIFCHILYLSSQLNFISGILNVKKIVFLVKYFILFATVSMITEIVFFPISVFVTFNHS